MNRHDPISPVVSMGAVLAAIPLEQWLTWLGYALILCGLVADWHVRRRWKREDDEANRGRAKALDLRLEALERRHGA